MTIDLIHLESIKDAKLLSSIVDATGETSTVLDTSVVVIQMREPAQRHVPKDKLLKQSSLHQISMVRVF